jgi:hypothetical protein
MRRSIFLSLAVAALVPSLAAAQDAQQRISEARARVLQAGIPTELLDSKIAEGRAKGVPMDRIALVVDQRANALLQARETLRGADPRGAEPAAADIGVAADAMQAGVSPVVLTAIAELAPSDRRAVAIAALTELMRLGYASEEALARVSQALARGPEALMSLPAQAAGAAQRRGPPAGVGGPGSAGGPPVSPPGQGRPPGGGF